MFRFAFLTGALACLFAGFAPDVQAKTITIALEGAYEPWNLTKPDGTLGGFEPELMNDLCERMKMSCKLIAQDWDGMMAALQAGKFDVIMDALSITPERQQQIAFSLPYANTPAAFATLKSGPLANMSGTGASVKLTGDVATGKSVTDPMRTLLKGKVIGLQSGTVYTKFIEDNFKDVATVREYKTAAEHDLDLIAGRIDVAFDDATYFTTAFAKADNADLAFTGPQIGGAIWGPGEGLGLRKADTELKAKFDSAIKDALADGTVKRLSLKWFKIDVQP